MIPTCMVVVFGLLAVATLVGCGETPRQETSQAAPTAEATKKAPEVALSEMELQSLAETQKVCAVSGEPLGSMGDPVPVSVTDSDGADHTVLLCCESCRDVLLENPDKYLARIASAETEAATRE